MNSWLDKAFVYHIFLDRFAGVKPDANAYKPSFCGGNIQGVKDKLPYIQSLGANTVWISPFYETSAYHAYHITDFDKPDSRFGSLEDIQDLIKACKKKGLRVIADIVPNHCSDQHKWFVDAFKNKNSKYRDWFYFKDDDYLKFLGFKELPKLNLENEELADYMTTSLINWAKLGFDGFRIDHVVGLPNKFLIKLGAELKKLNPEFVLIGEAWNDGMKYKYLKTLRLKGRYKHWDNGFKQVDIQNAYAGIIDGVLDFGWRDLIINNQNNIKTKKYNQLERNLNTYNKSLSQGLKFPRFLDNHDTNRIMYSCRGDKKLFAELLEILFKQPFPIVIYYGTEYGLTHTKPVSPEIGYSDLGARGFIPWTDLPEFGDLIAGLVQARKL